MASRCRRYLGSLAIREMQAETTIRFHLPPVRMVPSKNQIIMNDGRDGVGEATLKHPWLECKRIQPLWKESAETLLRTLKTGVLNDPAIPLLGIYPKEMKLALERIIRTPAVRSSTTIAKIRNKPSCPSIDDWIK